jgi:hypothetical protein
MYWRRYGYINYHSPADHDESIDSRQVCCQYDSSLWAGYGKISVTISSIRSCSIWSIPIFASSLFPSDRRQKYETSATALTCKLNLAMSPHRARCRDLTCRLRVSVTMQPMPLPTVFLTGDGVWVWWWWRSSKVLRRIGGHGLVPLSSLSRSGALWPSLGQLTCVGFGLRQENG